MKVNLSKIISYSIAFSFIEGKKLNLLWNNESIASGNISIDFDLSSELSV